MDLALTLLAIAGALVLALLLAFLPVRIAVGVMARKVRSFIQRQRDRRAEPRPTPDRRRG